MLQVLRQLIVVTALVLLCTVGSFAAESSTQARLAERSLFMDVAPANGRLVTVGERGHVLISDDQGITWSQKTVPTRTLLTNVFFLNDTNGWAVGYDQTILFTGDGGDSWQLQYVGEVDDQPLFDIWFADENHGFAVGAYALYLVTDDGGQSWQPASFDPDFGDESAESIDDDFIEEGDEGVDDDSDYDEEEPPPFDYHLNRLAVADSGALYIAAEAGYVFRSDDQGKSWLSLPSPYEGSYFGVTALSDDKLLLYGLRGNLFRSEDAGQSWTQVETATEALLCSGTQLADGTVLVAGDGGVVLVSEDDGRTFKSWRQKDGKTLSSLYGLASSRLVASTSGGLKILDVSSFKVGN